ncbi:MAG: Ferredoxin, 2Fe-2S [Actinomycetia bacterium]|nr:Ferredoxin, 2Fe-2S [Actinomycetes bacterium]
MSRHQLENVDEIEAGDLRCVEIAGKQLCVGRDDDGRLFAVDNLCTHEDFELSEGFLDGADIECPAHGSRFNIHTGDVKGLPATIPVRVFPVEIVGDEAFVEV